MIFKPNDIQGFLYTPGKYFLIPEFQRPYSWEADNIRSFLEDMESLLDTEQKHYFGSVVYVNDADDLNASVIIDGQQRITTALLMLMAIYHLTEIEPSKSQIEAEEIQEKYLFNSSKFSDQKNRIKLKAVTADDLIFKKIYEKENLDPKEKQSRVYQAYTQFYDYLKDRDRLDKYVNTLARFEIVTIALDSKDDNPQRVFESINSTGKPLTDGDKIRNFALMLNSNEDRNYIIQKYWKNIEAPLTDANQDYITDFFRSYIISKRQATIPFGSVYPEFKKLFARSITYEQRREDLDDFYSDIIKTLEYYRLVKFSEDTSGRFAALKNITFKMRYIQIELYIPFALSVLRYYDEGKLTDEELVKVFKLIETYFARRIVCNIFSTSVDRFLSTLHKDITELMDGSESNVSYPDVMAYIMLNRTSNTRIPNDTELELAVANNQTYNQRKTHVNFILTSVDDQSKEAALLQQISDQQIKLTIEHILPQTLTPSWRNRLGANADEIQEKYVHTLANLTLTGYNSEYSNRDFEDKKTMKNGFNDSPLAINREVKKAKNWDEVALQQRQKWWINNLEKVWSLPTTTYKPVMIDTEISLLSLEDDISLAGTKVRVLHLLGDDIQVSSWAQALDNIIERAFEIDEELYDKIIEDDWLAKYVRTDGSMLINPMQVNELEIFVESGTDTNTKRRIINKVSSLMNWDNKDITVELVEPLGQHTAIFTKYAAQENAGVKQAGAQQNSEYGPDYHLNDKSEGIIAQYHQLRTAALAIAPDVKESVVKTYIAYRSPSTWWLTLTFNKSKIWLEMNNIVSDERGLTTPGKHGSVFYSVTNEDDLRYALGMIASFSVD